MSTGRRFSAEEALNYGFVTEIVDDELLEERVEEVVKLYLNRPRTALSNLKKLLNYYYILTSTRNLFLK